MSSCIGATLVDQSCNNLSLYCKIWKLLKKKKLKLFSRKVECIFIFLNFILFFFIQLKYKETYQNEMKGHYVGIGMDKRMLHAMKVGSLASNVSPF